MYDKFDGGRPCIITRGSDGCRGVLYGFVTEVWTRGESYTIGGFPAGQECHTYALVENENGMLMMLEPRFIRLLDSEKLFNTFAWDEMISDEQ